MNHITKFPYLNDPLPVYVYIYIFLVKNKVKKLYIICLNSMTCMYIFNARRVLIFEHLIVTIGKKLNFTLESSMKQKTDTLQIKQILDISIIAHVFT